MPVTIPGRKGDTVVDTDEGPRRDTSVEALAALKPLTPGGTHTAGNSPGVNDGAAAVVVVAEEEAQRRGLAPLAIIRASACTADRHDPLARVPALAAQIALDKAGLTAGDIDRLEINEAFASVAFNSTKMLGVSEDRVNVNGGAGLRRIATRPVGPYLVVAAAVVAMLVADLSGMSKAEVERIWLPFAVWTSLSCAELPQPRRWLAAQAVLALVNHLLLTTW